MADHELHEEVDLVLEAARKKMLSDSSAFALNSVHGVAFHRGLGNPLHPASQTPIKKYITSDGLAEYSQAAYARSNFAVVANGATHGELSKWVTQFFKESPAKPPSNVPITGTDATKYYGGEERIELAKGNTIIVAFPGSSSFTGGAWKPEMAVLATLLGGQSSIKWSPGFSLLSKATQAFPLAHISTTHHTYSDAGLLAIEISGQAGQVREASFETVKALKEVASGNVSPEVVKKAVATARFQALDAGQNIDTGIELTGAGLIQGGKAHQIDEIGKSIGAVTEDQVKKVRLCVSSTAKANTFIFRRRKRYSRAKLQYQVSEISICCHLQRKWACMSKAIVLLSPLYHKLRSLEAISKFRRKIATLNGGAQNKDIMAVIT